MALNLPDQVRRVIPRWRDFRATARLGELRSPDPSKKAVSIPTDEFVRKLAEWRQDGTIEAAVDLLSTAIVVGRSSEASDAADHLLSLGHNLAPITVHLAREVIGCREEQPELPLDMEVLPLEEELARDRIRAIRQLLGGDPRNAVLWTELSRAYILRGQATPAIKAMDRALASAPHNRYVLRCAARLFVHVDDPERAHDTLASSQATKADPWLIAAEIAVASIAERAPQFVRTGRSMLSAGVHGNFNTSELASAIGTAEFLQGTSRSWRKLFRQSILAPTENAVAQFAWASRHAPGLDIDPEILRMPRSYEARAWVHSGNLEWTAVAEQCAAWLNDEAFSGRPAMMGSYVSIVALENYELAEAFARRGLRANPDDDLLLNNLTVSLVNQGKQEEAEQVLRGIHQSESAPDVQAALRATAGLLMFRKGDIAGGRAAYADAIEMLRRDGEMRSLAIAYLHLAREEILCRSSHASTALAKAEEVSRSVRSPEVHTMLEHVRMLSQAVVPP